MKLYTLVSILLFSIISLISARSLSNANKSAEEYNPCPNGANFCEDPENYPNNQIQNAVEESQDKIIQLWFKLEKEKREAAETM